MNIEKSGLHPRNKHKSNYDFPQLLKVHAELANFVVKNKFGNESIDFSNRQAVIALNSALLKFFYGISYWQIPISNLCPPIPGRVDYIHYLADLLPPTKSDIFILDIGVGANCIYPLLSYKEYGWHTIGSDIDLIAMENAQEIINKNHLTNVIKLRHQKNKTKIFENIILSDDYFHLTICNPPFHASAQAAQDSNMRKNKNLGLAKNNLNFGGKNNELWCEGGEFDFINRMIDESILNKKNCLWFTTLVSKSENLAPLQSKLKKMNVLEIKTIEMNQGQKKSRILAWSFG